MLRVECEHRTEVCSLEQLYCRHLLVDFFRGDDLSDGMQNVELCH